MLGWILQITIISFIIIFLLHHLFQYFKTILTVPKIKDLVNTSSHKYETMYNIINKSNDISTANEIPSNNAYTLIDLLPTTDSANMKDELKTFLKAQLHSEDNIVPYSS